MVTQEIPDGYKKCTRCKKIQPASNFTRNCKTKDGLMQMCRQCNHETVSEWQQSNKEKNREKARRWSRENAAKNRDSTARDRAKNPDRNAEYYQRWVDKNQDKVVGYSRTRQRREKQVVRSMPPNIESILLKIQRGNCLYCGKTLTEHQMDHIIAFALVDFLGVYHPGHTPPNVALTCLSCNVSKHDWVLEDWLAEKRPAQMDEILHRVDRHIALLTELWAKCGEDDELWMTELAKLNADQ